MLLKKGRRIITGTDNGLEEWLDNFFPGGDMISSNRAAQQRAATVSHARQEKICQEVHEYLTRIKLRKLKEAVLQLNKTIRQMLQ